MMGTGNCAPPTLLQNHGDKEEDEDQGDRGKREGQMLTGRMKIQRLLGQQSPVVQKSCKISFTPKVRGKGAYASWQTNFNDSRL